MSNMVRWFSMLAGAFYLGAVAYFVWRVAVYARECANALVGLQNVVTDIAVGMEDNEIEVTVRDGKATPDGYL